MEKFNDLTNEQREIIDRNNQFSLVVESLDHIDSQSITDEPFLSEPVYSLLFDSLASGALAERPDIANRVIRSLSRLHYNSIQQQLEKASLFIKNRDISFSVWLDQADQTLSRVIRKDEIDYRDAKILYLEIDRLRGIGIKIG